MSVHISEMDVLDWARDYTGPKFHALFGDPPYHLTSITRRFGKDGSAPAQYGRDGAFQRASRGFMNQQWDGGDIAFQPETWAALAGHLHPGAFGMAFAAARGWHRLACAIEDAGPIIHPSIFGWAYGSGFPKATRVKGAVTSDVFEGHRYGLQALKPALEPVIVFQKPYEGRPVDCITRTGVGALNVAAGRIPLQRGDQKGEFGPHRAEHLNVNNTPGVYGHGRKRQNADNGNGRWPANLVLQHEPGCNGECVAGCPVKVMGDSARFFFQADWSLDVAEGLEWANPVIYQAKASRRERDAGVAGRNPHPAVKPLALLRHLAGLLLPPVEYAPRRILVPFAGSGSEMIGAMLAGWEEIVGIEREAGYVAVARARLAHYTNAMAENLHFRP